MEMAVAHAALAGRLAGEFGCPPGPDIPGVLISIDAVAVA
jgi:hypothetical protein